MRRVLIILVALLFLAAGLLYFLGRSRVLEVPSVNERPPALGEGARLTSLVLYFGDPRKIALREETRVLLFASSLSDRLAACIEELAAGSSTGGLPVIPEAARLRRAYVDPSGLAYLDFERTILQSPPPGDGREWLAVASIVRTICDNFPEVRRVRFMIEGQVVTSLSGYIDLEEPLAPESFPLGSAGP